TWTVANFGLRATQAFSIAFDPQSPGTLYAGTDFGAFKSTDGGQSWHVLSSGIKLQYPAGWVVALAVDPLVPSNVYAGTGEDECGYGSGGVFRSVDGGMSWIDSGVISCISALVVDPRAPSIVYAATQYSGV